MSEAKFTKGEWNSKVAGKWFNSDDFYIDSDNHGSFSWVGVGCNGETVALIPTVNDTDSMHHNTQLIACAPEMYELLEFISDNPSEVNVVQIRNLLSKARGEL